MHTRTTQNCTVLRWVSHKLTFLDVHWLTIFVVLHPSHKLAYFAQAGWDDAWCATAEEIVRAEFERAYADLEVMDSQNGEHVRKRFLICTLIYYFVLGQRWDDRQHIWCLTHTFRSCKGGVEGRADTVSDSTSGADSWTPSVVDREASSLSVPLSNGPWLSQHSW